MKTLVVKLATGIQIGDRKIRTFKIRETRLSDILDADEAAPGHSQLRLSIETLARRVVEWDGKNEPMPPSLLLSLSDSDWLVANDQIEKWDAGNLAAAMEEVGLTDPGRDDAA